MSDQGWIPCPPRERGGGAISCPGGRDLSGVLLSPRRGEGRYRRVSWGPCSVVQQQ